MQTFLVSSLCEVRIKNRHSIILEGRYYFGLADIFNNKIERAKLLFEFREKGKTYLKNHIKSLNNPSDMTLKQTVEKQVAELAKLNDRITELSPKKKDVVIKYFDKVATISPSSILNSLINTIGKKSPEKSKND